MLTKLRGVHTIIWICVCIFTNEYLLKTRSAFDKNTRVLFDNTTKIRAPNGAAKTTKQKAKQQRVDWLTFQWTNPSPVVLAIASSESIKDTYRFV